MSARWLLPWLELWACIGVGVGMGVAVEPPKPETQPPAKTLERQKLALVPGKFGQALDAQVSPAVVQSSDRYRKPPLTVECWAKLDSKESFNILVASDPKNSLRHWEIYSYAQSGHFAAYLPGYQPSEIVSQVDICDQRWHYLAMTFDGQRVKLFVDGTQVKEQLVTPIAEKNPKSRPVDGPLTIGMVVVDGKTMIGCRGRIDEVRISSGIREIHAVPTAELPLDPPTIGLWRFDASEIPTADPAWTPRPAEGKAASWERETDADWVDSRLQQMDTGPTFNATMDYPSWQGKARSYKATAIRLGDAAVMFDRNQLRYAAGWTGGFLQHSSRRFGLLNTPTPLGNVVFASASQAGWADPNGSWSRLHPATAPLPSEWAKYRGLYLHGQRAVLCYTVGNVEVLDTPSVEKVGAVTVFVRDVEIAARTQELQMLLADFPPKVNATLQQFGKSASAWRWSQGGVDGWIGVVAASEGSVTLHADAGRALARIAKSTTPTTLRVVIAQGTANDIDAVASWFRTARPLADVQAFKRPAGRRWPEKITTQGELGTGAGPLVIDTLTVPYDNPYRALMFLSGVDFLPNGEIAVCTAHGDVWLVRGADAQLKELTWKRFATGLYQPLGLKVVDGKIHVIERGQLTRLHDLNHDGEADFYQNVNNDWHTGNGEHSFDTCLETDPQGNWYFFKTGDTDTPTGGCLMRVSADGAKAEVFATGFRHPIGLGMSPTGVLSGADQEGNWMPATRIDLYRQGGFYGDMRAHHRATPPTIYDGPLCWLPREIDNSAGGQVWIPAGQWGPLGGQMLHLSYGRCKLLLVFRQQVEGIVQGGAYDLGLFFLSGVMRGRFRDADGCLYVAGLRGWQTAARRDGCLQRVRYTGKPLACPIGLQVHANGFRVHFTDKLDPASVGEVKSWQIEQWNYRWTADYGSRRWSVTRPEQQGQDPIEVHSVTLADDAKSVFVRTATEVRPVMQYQLRYQAKTATGQPVVGVLFGTIHQPAPAVP